MKKAVLCTWASLLFLCFIVRDADAQNRADETDSETGTVSIILLQKKAPELTKERLTERVSKAWPVIQGKKPLVRTANSPSPHEGESAFLIVVSPDHDILVTVSSQPYVDPADIDQVSDIRSKKMLRDHAASVSLRMESKGLRKSNVLISELTKLAAELVDANTLGIMIPSEEILLPRESDLVSLLRSADPFSALRKAANVPVLSSEENDPKMKAAVAQARSSWNQFEMAFRKKAENTESFNVKFPFQARDRVEFMWVEVTSIKDDVVTGKLGNDPVWATDLKIGDEVNRNVSELADWMYLQDGELVGGFSVKVLMEKSRSQPAE